jgi:hypothetical protein
LTGRPNTQVPWAVLIALSRLLLRPHYLKSLASKARTRLKVPARVALYAASICACGGPRATGPATPLPAHDPGAGLAQGLACNFMKVGAHDVLGVVTWKTPLPGLELGVGRPNFDLWCALPRSNSSTVGRFILRPGETRLRYVVLDRSARWVEFDDMITCAEGSRVDVQIETHLLADGRLVLSTTIAGVGCRTRHIIREPRTFAPADWEHALPCTKCAGFPWEE